MIPQRSGWTARKTYIKYLGKGIHVSFFLLTIYPIIHLQYFLWNSRQGRSYEDMTKVRQRQVLHKSEPDM